MFFPASAHLRILQRGLLDASRASGSSVEVFERAIDSNGRSAAPAPTSTLSRTLKRRQLPQADSSTAQVAACLPTRTRRRCVVHQFGLAGGQLLSEGVQIHFGLP